MYKRQSLNTSSPDKPIQLGLRPEHIKIGEGELSGSIKTVESLGAETVVELDFNGAEILSLYQGAFQGQKGDKVNFAIDQNKILFFDEKGMSVQ